MGPQFTNEIEIRYFLGKEDHQKKRKKVIAKKKTLQEMVAEAMRGSEQQSTDNDTKQESCNKTTNEIIEAELNQANNIII